MVAAEVERVIRAYQGDNPARRRALHETLLAPRVYYRTYRRDIEAWLYDCIDWPNGRGPTVYQVEILTDFVDHRRMAVVGPHGLGKTTTEALAALWFSTTREAGRIDWKMPTTASNWRQLRHFLWPEIHKWARKLKWDRIAHYPFKPRVELLDTEIQLEHGRAYAAASNVPGAMEGAHADSLFYVFDESKLVPSGAFDAAEGAMAGAGADTGNEAFALAMSTPGPKMGRFYDIHARKPGLTAWKTRHVKIEECIAARRVSAEWAEERRQQWGENSAVYQNKVLGLFAADDDNTVIPLAWVELAIDRWYEWVEQGRPKAGRCTIGADIAGEGDNKTVFAIRWGRVVAELRKFSKADTMETAGRLKGIAQSTGGRVVVDVIGYGGGVYDRLREERVPGVVGFNAAHAHPGTDRTGEQMFSNARSAGWWQLREALDPAFGADLALPPDDELIGELTTPLYRIVGAGRIQVESKEDIAKRIDGRSTDSADAVMQACYTPPPVERDPKSYMLPTIGGARRG